jgi:hypothetical protein
VGVGGDIINNFLLRNIDESVELKSNNIIASKFELICEVQITGPTFLYLQLTSPQLWYCKVFLVLHKPQNNSYTVLIINQTPFTFKVKILYMQLTTFAALNLTC